LNEALRINPALVQARLALARGFTPANEPKSALDLLNRTPALQKNTLAVVTERKLGAVGSRRNRRVAVHSGTRLCASGIFRNSSFRMPFSGFSRQYERKTGGSNPLANRHSHSTGSEAARIPVLPGKI
jgi:hypothetical protein